MISMVCDPCDLCPSSGVQFDRLELDRFAKPLVMCPLVLHPKTYFPDTVDLTHDDDARTYWLQCFEDATDKVSAAIGRGNEEEKIILFILKIY